jgi:hypothetical protein
MNLSAISNVILTLLPVISDTVKAVEGQSSTPGNGKAKLDLALAIIKPLYDASSPVVPFDQIVGHVTAVIGALVTFYNSVGAFVKAAKAA